jgi:hypothetical protein
VSSNLHIDKMMFYQLAIMIFTITSIWYIPMDSK